MRRIVSLGVQAVRSLVAPPWRLTKCISDHIQRVQPLVTFLGVVVAVSVLIVYVFILFQSIEQNKKLQRSINSQAYQGIIDTEFDSLLTVLENDRLQPPYLRTFGYPTDDTEQNRETLGAILLFEFFNNIQIQYANGAVREDVFCAWLADIDLFLNGYLALKDVWPDLRGIYNDDFVFLIEDRLSDNPSTCDDVAERLR
jgi:hypothetical protein